MPITGSPLAPSTDLVAQADLLAALAAANAGALTAAEQALLPSLASWASDLIRKECHRRFNRATYSERYTVPINGTLMLREFPVNRILRLAVNPTVVLSVSNTDATTNQRASVELATTGSQDAGFTVTGLRLVRVASAVEHDDSVAITAGQTLQALADLVNAVGSGWSATCPDGRGLWPSTDLVPVQGAYPALGLNSADFVLHVDEIPFNLDPRSGAVYVSQSAIDPTSSFRFGPQFQTSFDDPILSPGELGIHAIYDAGFDVVPGPIQGFAIETVHAWLARFKTDPLLQSESDGTYSWSRGSLETMLDLPWSVKVGLTKWINHSTQ